jgi:hypothetical protein
MEACKLPLNATFHDLIEEQLKTQQWKGAMIVKGAHGRLHNICPEGNQQTFNDLAHYDRQPLDHPDRPYKFLMSSMERNILTIQMKRNRANDAAAIRAGTVGGFGKAVPALGAPNPWEEGCGQSCCESSGESPSCL